MTDILRPVLELFVIIPGILLAYLPVKNYLRQTPLKLQMCIRDSFHSSVHLMLRPSLQDPAPAAPSLPV